VSAKNRDTGVLETRIVRAVSPVDVNVVYTAEVKRKDAGFGGKKSMGYNDFLNGLMKLSTRVFKF
jgi:hypothetical protein